MYIINTIFTLKNNNTIKQIIINGASRSDKYKENNYCLMWFKRNFGLGLRLRKAWRISHI